jgi:hypothetical protein
MQRKLTFNKYYYTEIFLYEIVFVYETAYCNLQPKVVTICYWLLGVCLESKSINQIRQIFQINAFRYISIFAFMLVSKFEFFPYRNFIDVLHQNVNKHLIYLVRYIQSTCCIREMMKRNKGWR